MLLNLKAFTCGWPLKVRSQQLAGLDKMIEHLVYQDYCAQWIKLIHQMDMNVYFILNA